MTTLAQQWLEEGFEKGVQQGMQQGMQQGGYSLLLRQLEHKFKTVPESYRLFLTQADAQTLLRLGERILEARSLAKVFEVAD